MDIAVQKCSGEVNKRPNKRCFDTVSRALYSPPSKTKNTQEKYKNGKAAVLDF